MHDSFAHSHECGQPVVVNLDVRSLKARMQGAWYHAHAVGTHAHACAHLRALKCLKCSLAGVEMSLVLTCGHLNVFSAHLRALKCLHALAQVVGIYYSAGGLEGLHEELSFCRDRDNKADENAIKVQATCLIHHGPPSHGLRAACCVCKVLKGAVMALVVLG